MDQFASHRASEKVHDLETFLSFLEVLRKDWESASVANASKPSIPYDSMYGWENTNIGDFLEAAIAGARDNNLGKPGGTCPDDNAWRQAAEILLMGKLYE